MIELNEYEIKTVNIGEPLDIVMPDPFQHIKFDVYEPGRYIVTVDENGNYIAQRDYLFRKDEG